MNRKEWSSLLAQFPPGLSGAEIARRIKQQPQLVAYWLKKLRYESVDGRAHPKAEKFNKIRRVKGQIDWSESSNQVLATRHGVSRERIRQLRQRITKS
jgi:N-acetyl-gamma-glutamylphosphate reductase